MVRQWAAWRYFLLRRRAAAVDSEPEMGWLPTDLPTGLWGWYRGYSGVTYDGGNNVSEIADGSGAGRDLAQLTGSAQPLREAAAVNGHDAILFNGTSHFLQTAPDTLNQPCTVYLLLKPVSWSYNDRMFDGVNADRSLLQYPVSPGLALYAGGYGAVNSGLAMDELGIITAIFNFDQSVLQVNDLVETTGNPGGNNMGGFTLGARSSGWDYGNFQFVEAIVRTGVDDAAARNLHKEYLAGVGGVSL